MFSMQVHGRFDAYRNLIRPPLPATQSTLRFVATLGWSCEGRRQEEPMTPQERQLIDDLFGRLAKLENAPRDPEAVAAIAQGLRQAPNAAYALVQTVLVQD